MKKVYYTQKRNISSSITASALLLGLSTLPALATDYGSLNDSVITLANGDTITADTKYNNILTGIYNNSATTAQINLASGSKVSVDGGNTASAGIYLNGKNTTLNANHLTIDVKGFATKGLYVSGLNSQIDLGTDSKIIVDNTSTSSSAIGVYIAKASTLTADALTIQTIGNQNIGLNVDNEGTEAHLGSGSLISTNGSQSTALRIFGANGNAANGPAKFEATHLTLETQGNLSYGIDLQQNSFVDLGTGSTITTQGAYATGVFLFGKLNADALSITTMGNNSNALEVRSGGLATVGADSHIWADKSSGLIAHGSNAIAHFNGTPTNRNSIFSGGSTGASAQLSGVVNLENTDIIVDRNGNTAYAVWAAGGVVNAVNTTVTGADGVYGVVANSSGGKAYFTGDTTITMASSDAVAMVSAGAGNLISGVGKMHITGGVYSQDGATTDLRMTEGSVLNGGAFVSSGATTNLSLDDSLWNMSQDSVVSKLTLNHSTVDFIEDKVGSILTVGDLSGNGNFIMRTNILDEFSDKLVVTGSSTGNHSIQIINRGSLATTGNEVITVVETQDGLASFDLKNNLFRGAGTGEVELGGYLYSLHQNDTNWELYASSKAPPITSTADASANFLNIGYMINYAETQTLLQRMGELRETENSQGNVWARTFTGKFGSFGSGKLSDFDMGYTGIQTGIDGRLKMSDLDVFLGVMGGTIQADSNYQQGNGNVNGHHFGFYGTYIASNHFYVDMALKYSHIKNTFNVQDSQYNHIHGSTSSNGYGLSVEAGKRFYLVNTTTGYYIEPQAQLSYLHQNSSSTHADNGLVVDLDGYDSTLGRVSVKVGYEVKEVKNPVNVYYKTGYVTEMSGNVGYRLNGNLETYTFRGNLWENQVGIATQLNKKHNLYLDGTYTTGHKFVQRQINAGYRFSF
ncbi:autotransporter outer membrane beta-barrel domain-containing protein [Sulfurospirillum barnesii]|uniref:Outer membrane autotransporter barrel domain-containing protein n=1 Tax=Sulfurospirillum barnesii (strain ATCC 700032 / DSM 10660 / SES-3) TaxID=760154 RepID=I3XXH9_SULBS|nr:autotransporter outer membrane beta-barrel domain-containing protein [Sulfurospirillum barnesii]AFL68653.1 outer membrane autotransporter barrel domain-containing protein [Sulfurospirillum barnesii SES-3]